MTEARVCHLDVQVSILGGLSSCSTVWWTFSGRNSLRPVSLSCCHDPLVDGASLLRQHTPRQGSVSSVSITSDSFTMLGWSKTFIILTLWDSVWSPKDSYWLLWMIFTATSFSVRMCQGHLTLVKVTLSTVVAHMGFLLSRDGGKRPQSRLPLLLR